jgi:hypothetical protein
MNINEKLNIVWSCDRVNIKFDAITQPPHTYDSVFCFPPSCHHPHASHSKPGETMHACLGIPEIIGIVVSGLDAKLDGQELAALARTSTIFHEWALDELWKHQHTIENLMQCMPADLWNTTDGVIGLIGLETPVRHIGRPSEVMN